MRQKSFSPDATVFLFVQLGAHAADRFGEHVAPLQISPRQAGILRLIATTPGCNQQDLARRLGVLPSQMVLLIDELSEKKLVKRQRSTEDRRVSRVRRSGRAREDARAKRMSGYRDGRAAVEPSRPVQRRSVN